MALASQCMEEMQSFASLKYVKHDAVICIAEICKIEEMQSLASLRYVKSDLFSESKQKHFSAVAVGLEAARCFETQPFPRDVYLSSGLLAGSLMYKLLKCCIAHLQTASVFRSDACSEIQFEECNFVARWPRPRNVWKRCSHLHR